MITKQQIEAIALDYALNVVFCNVGEKYWPEDPMEFLGRSRDEEDFLSMNEMIVWEPFDAFNTDRIYDTVLDFQHTFIQAINEALTLDRG